MHGEQLHSGDSAKSSSKDSGAGVKRGLKTKITSYRRLCGLTLLAMSAGLTMAAIFAWAPVSARQAAGPSATTDHSPSSHPEFPPGEGRDAVMRLCVKCHSPNIILASGQDRVGWENTITKMARLGAVGSDEDFTDVADYLTTNFPPSPIQKIFVNMATAKQFAAVLEISEDDGKAVVAYRDKQKGFKSIDDMKQVPNVDTKKIEANKDHLIF
jgi:competence protein ComEA